MRTISKGGRLQNWSKCEDYGVGGVVGREDKRFEKRWSKKDERFEENICSWRFFLFLSILITPTFTLLTISPVLFASISFLPSFHFQNYAILEHHPTKYPKQQPIFTTQTLASTQPQTTGTSRCNTTTSSS